MPNKTTNEVMNALYAEINNFVNPTDTSPNAPEAAGYATLQLPGTTVLAKDFDTSTPDGKINLYSTLDAIPGFSKQYVNSGQTVSGLFKMILGADTPRDDKASAAKKLTEYNEALATYTTNKTEYQDCQDDYEDAVDDYLVEKGKGEPDVNSLRKLNRAVKRAMDDWLTIGHKNEVDHALAVMKRYLAYTPTSVFAKAQEIFEDERKKSDVDMSPVECIPSTWATNPDDLSWTKVIIKQNSAISKTRSEVEKISSSFEAGARYGLWSASGSGGYKQETAKLNATNTVDNLSFSFEIAKVALNRKWFAGDLLNYPNVTISGLKIGELCAGKLSKASESKYSFIPTTMIIVRDVNIYNEFTSEEESFINKSKDFSADVKVGYGPFYIGNKTSYSKNLTETEKKEFGNVTKISIGDGQQIIGYVNSVLKPAFPSADGNALKKSNISINATDETTVEIDQEIIKKLSDVANFNNRYGTFAD